MAVDIKAASVYATTEFRMDNASWRQLTRFEKRIDKIKKKFQSFASHIVEGNKKIKKSQESLRKSQLERAQFQFDTGLNRQGLDTAARAKLLTDFQRLKKEYMETGMSAYQFRTRMMKLTHEMRTQGKTVTSLNDRYRSLRRSMINLTGAYSVFLGISGVAQTGKQFESAQTLFETLFPENAKNEMAFLKSEAERLGVNLLDATKAYAKFSFSAQKAGVTLQETRDIYTAFSEASVVMGLTQEEVAKSFKAIIQMFSKGNVQMEELRGQLGDNLVGALEIVREELGYTGDQMNQFEKDVEQGKIKANELVPALAQGLKKISAPGLAKALELLERKQQRLVNSFQEVKNILFTGGLGDGLGYLYESLITVLEAVKPLAEALGFGFRGAVLAVISPVRLLSAIMHDFSNLLDRLGDAVGIDGLTAKVFKLVGALLSIKLVIGLWSRLLSLITKVAGFFGFSGAAGTAAKTASIANMAGNTAKSLLLKPGAGSLGLGLTALAGQGIGSYLREKTFGTNAEQILKSRFELEVSMKDGAEQFIEAKLSDKLKTSTQE